MAYAEGCDGFHSLPRGYLSASRIEVLLLLSSVFFCASCAEEHTTCHAPPDTIIVRYCTCMYREYKDACIHTNRRCSFLGVGNTVSEKSIQGVIVKMGGIFLRSINLKTPLLSIEGPLNFPYLRWRGERSTTTQLFDFYIHIHISW